MRSMATPLFPSAHLRISAMPTTLTTGSSSRTRSTTVSMSTANTTSDHGDSLVKKVSWFDDKPGLAKSVGQFIDRAASNLLHKGSISKVDVNGLWDICDSCGAMLYTRSDDYMTNKRICNTCGYHLRCGSTDRIEQMIDEGTWTPMDEDMLGRDVLGFRDQEDYENRLVVSRKRAGLTDAVQTGVGKMGGREVALGVMDFRFMGGSMGSVVGERLTRLIEHATERMIPVIIVCSSGGARMQEGTLSLMQMAKVSAALQIHQNEKGLLYIPVLTNPTTGGVTASFGMLGDLIMAEPKAYVAFAGGRVIQQTIRKQLPEGFQTAEYVFEHGLVDLIVPGSLLKSCLCEVFSLYAAAPMAKRNKAAATL